MKAESFELFGLFSCIWFPPHPVICTEDKYLSLLPCYNLFMSPCLSVFPTHSLSPTHGHTHTHSLGYCKSPCCVWETVCVNLQRLVLHEGEIEAPTIESRWSFVHFSVLQISKLWRLFSDHQGLVTGCTNLSGAGLLVGMCMSELWVERLWTGLSSLLTITLTDLLGTFSLRPNDGW